MTFKYIAWVLLPDAMVEPFVTVEIHAEMKGS